MKQLCIFFGLANLISWTIWLPLYGHLFGLTNLPTLPFQHGIGGLGPLIGAFLTTWIFYKKKGIGLLLARCLKARPFIYFIIALLSPFLLVCLASVISFFTDKTPINFNGLLRAKEFPQFNFLFFFLYNLLFFGFGEEVGWRGFALPRLQNQFNAFVSSIILTLFWALWHWPLFFYRPGYTAMDMAGISGWLFSLLTGSVLLTSLFNSSKGSVLICAVFHSTIDIAFTADVAGKNIPTYMGFLITIWGIVTIMIFKPKNLAFTQKQKVSS